MYQLVLTYLFDLEIIFLQVDTEVSKVPVTIRATTASHKEVAAAVDTEAAVEVTAPVAEAVDMAPVVEATEAATEVRVAKSNQTTVQE